MKFATRVVPDFQQMCTRVAFMSVSCVLEIVSFTRVKDFGGSPE